jgi:hypothetical protein
MTAHDDFNAMFSDWLDDQAGRGAPDYLDEILVRTIRTRQRPAWSSLERWLPVQLTFSGRLAPIPRLAWIMVVLAMLVLAAAALLVVGVGQRRLPHFGAAANGQIAFVDGGNLKVAAADGTNSSTLTVLPDGAERFDLRARRHPVRLPDDGIRPGDRRHQRRRLEPDRRRPRGGDRDRRSVRLVAGQPPTHLHDRHRG